MITAQTNTRPLVDDKGNGTHAPVVQLDSTPATLPPVNVLPKLGASTTLAVTTTTANVTLPGGGSRYSVTADGCNMAVKAGGGAVSAAVTDHLVPTVNPSPPSEPVELPLPTPEAPVAP